MFSRILAPCRDDATGLQRRVLPTLKGKSEWTFAAYVSSNAPL